MKTVGIADLKARLSEHLQAVRKGRSVTVVDRRTPVARLVPYVSEPLEIRHATRRPQSIKLAGRPERATDSLTVILDDRARR